MTWFDGDGSPARDQGGPEVEQRDVSKAVPSAQGRMQLLLDEHRPTKPSDVAASFLRMDPADEDPSDMSIGAQVRRMAKGSMVVDGQLVTKGQTSIDGMEPMIKSECGALRKDDLFVAGDPDEHDPAERLPEEMEHVGIPHIPTHATARTWDYDDVMVQLARVYEKGEITGVGTDCGGDVQFNKAEGGLPAIGAKKLPKPPPDPETKKQEEEQRMEAGMDKGEITPEKARQILHDGEVHGKPITEQQRKYFGAIGGHLPAPKMKKAGPYIGPQGGKYADPEHKIAWKEPLHQESHSHGKYHVEHHGAGVHALYFKGARKRKPELIGNFSSMEGAKAGIQHHAKTGWAKPSSIGSEINPKAEWLKKGMDAMDDFLKKAEGEGSRGGKVIGHTAGGKPVYAPHEDHIARVREHVNLQKRTAKGKLAEHADHHLRQNAKGYSSADHESAAKFHASEAKNFKNSEKVRAFHQAISEAHSAKAVDKPTPAKVAATKTDQAAAKRSAAAKKKEAARPKKTIATTEGGHEIKNTHHVRYNVTGASLHEGPASGVKGAPHEPIETEWGEHLSAEKHKDIAEHHRSEAHKYATRHEREGAPKFGNQRIGGTGDSAAKMKMHEHAAELHEAEARKKSAPSKNQTSFNFKSFVGSRDSLQKAEGAREMNDPLAIMDDWLQKAEMSGGLRVADPRTTYDTGVSVSRDEDGGKLAGVGGSSGAVDAGIETVASTSGAGKIGKEKLSDDDADDEGQMRAHEKPIQKMTKADDEDEDAVEAEGDDEDSMSSYEKPIRKMYKAEDEEEGDDEETPDGEVDEAPMDEEEEEEEEEEGEDESQKSFAGLLENALGSGEWERARIVSQIRKSEDMIVGLGVPDRRIPDEVERPSEPVHFLQQGGAVLYSTGADLQVEGYLKKGGYYQPSNVHVMGSVHKTTTCPHCAALTKSIFTDCQSCGMPIRAADTVHGAGGQLVMEKSVAQSLIPPDDLDIEIG